MTVDESTLLGALVWLGLLIAFALGVRAGKRAPRVPENHIARYSCWCGFKCSSDSPEMVRSIAADHSRGGGHMGLIKVRGSWESVEQ